MFVYGGRFEIQIRWHNQMLFSILNITRSRKIRGCFLFLIKQSKWISHLSGRLQLLARISLLIMVNNLGLEHLAFVVFSMNLVIKQIAVCQVNRLCNIIPKRMRVR